MANHLPVGIILTEKSCQSQNINHKKRWYNCLIWILTYCVYLSFHLSRKPISVVKGVLHQNCSALPDNINHNDTTWCYWPPFDDDNYKTLLGVVDSCFLFAYAAGMFFCGTIAERMDLRYFLTIGMILSGIFTSMFGLGHSWNIHVLWYYALAMVLNGIVQASGWPSVVAAMGNWFGKSKRGLIMGVWNSHTSMGNIFGTLIASAFLTSKSSWTYSFVVPGLIIGVMGIVVFLFLVPQPSYVNLPNPNMPKDEDEDTSQHNKPPGTPSSSAIDIPSTNGSYVVPEQKAISFIGALTIPGVIEFSLCLFFAKLVSYTFLYWLPNYLQNNTSYDSQDSADLSTLFDIGGAIGGIMAGIISDTTGKPASTCAVMLILAIPMMFIYNVYGNVNLGLNIFQLMIVGVLVNGPYSLITTAVSAELGTHESLMGNSHALATVSSIIDGTGSIGAAVGPLLAGSISEYGWDYVFYMLMGADVLALILLTRLVYHDILSICRSRR